MCVFCHSVGSQVSRSSPTCFCRVTNIVSGRFAYARDPLQLDRFTDASSPSSGSVPR